MEIIILTDGPIMVNGEAKIIQTDGSIVESEKSFLCRCGGSNKKPYCDGTHKKINFKD